MAAAAEEAAVQACFRGDDIALQAVAVQQLPLGLLGGVQSKVRARS
jgi:hypothetical protein